MDSGNWLYKSLAAGLLFNSISIVWLLVVVNFIILVCVKVDDDVVSVVVFYDDFHANNDLYELGHVISGEDIVSELSGIVTIETMPNQWGYLSWTVEILSN